MGPAGAPQALREAGPHDRRPLGWNPPVHRAQVTNAPVEGFNSKIRMISHRAFGFHHASSLIAMIKLNCAGITLSPVGHGRLAHAA